MIIFLTILYILAAVCLVAFVLLHSPKGEGIGGIGGQARVFGSAKGVEAGLNKVTAFFATLFFVLSFLLAYLLR